MFSFFQVLNVFDEVLFLIWENINNCVYATGTCSQTMQQVFFVLEQFTLLKTNMLPENQWVKKYIPH